MGSSTSRSLLSRVVCPVVCLVVSVVFLSVSIFLLAISSLRLHALNSSPSTTSLLLHDFYIPGSATYPVLLPSADGDDDLDGFNPSSLSGIEVSTQPFSNGGDSPVADINVKLFTGSCNFNYTDIEFPKSARVLKPFSDIRLPFNYNYGNLPFYAAGENSTLTYALSSSNAPIDRPQTDECLLELFLFDDFNKYKVYIETEFNAEGYLDRSGCLPVGDKNDTKTSKTVFQLTKPNSYYVAIASKTDIETSANISAHVREFNDKQLQMVDCALNDFVSKCSITFGNTNSKFPKTSSTGSPAAVCVWAIARHGVKVNVTAHSIIYKDEVIVCGSVVAGSGVFVLAMLCFIGIIIVIQCRHRRQQKIYNQLIAPHEKKSLLPTEYGVNSAKTIQYN